MYKKCTVVAAGLLAFALASGGPAQAAEEETAPSETPRRAGAPTDSRGRARGTDANAAGRTSEDQRAAPCMAHWKSRPGVGRALWMLALP